MKRQLSKKYSVLILDKRFDKNLFLCITIYLTEKKEGAMIIVINYGDGNGT